MPWGHGREAALLSLSSREGFQEGYLRAVWKAELGVGSCRKESGVGLRPLEGVAGAEERTLATFSDSALCIRGHAGSSEHRNG